MSLPILILLLHFSLLQPPSSSHPDADPLLAFKSISDPSNMLASWNTTTTICTSWRGISCLPNGRVSKLVLENLNLRGPFPIPLLSLTNLHVLSLSRNDFNGTLPSNISSLSSLKLLFLSHNSFTGTLPDSLSNISRLYRLDLAYNNLSGQILPSVVNQLTNLLTLRLESNRFTGEISELNLPNIQDFKVSSNQFAGRIPKSFSTFPVSAFSGNKALCGTPLLPCKEMSTNPTKPGDDKNGAVASPVGPAVVVSSTPSTGPTKVEPPKDNDKSKKKSTTKISLWAIIVIILADILVLLLIVLLIYCYFLNKTATTKHNGHNAGSPGNNRVVEKVIYSNPVNSSASGGGFERQNGKMVFFDGSKKFELEDLLRASAEMLGKGVLGTAYKAVLDDGNVVAVKRLKEIRVTGKKEFDEQMEILGRLRHQNLVALKAYYFARDEKLLVFDYLPNASLFWLLHGNRGPGRTPLDWTTRLKIASGAGRGVAFIHNTCKALKLIHGNIKSTNILIDKDGNACVSDFGLSNFAPMPPGNPRSNGYHAPESLDGRRLTQKADVYSFGVLLLELLTGKYPSIVEASSPYGTIGVGGVLDLPRWVQSVVREEWTAEVFDLELMRYKDIEEEMVGLLQIAMACTSASPDQRPTMSHVVRMIEEIRGVDVSPSHEPFDSESPSLSEDTGGGSQ